MIYSASAIQSNPTASDGTADQNVGTNPSNSRRHKMKQFLFFTTEGFTFDPHHKELHNMQILGDGMGEDVLEAFMSFKRNQDYLLSHGFKEIIAVQYVGDMIRPLEL
jgi:hypothetical protein